ncbi:hypothetical protein A4R26_21605 [Niastella populi]|uniref:Uncharacterized protein n=1 Tax=Niastella populi TaxID=550983 RepID=A0A1V9FKW7_9BACT|nr:hypothetical protein A4R26_21605 [Niastella populi]
MGFVVLRPGGKSHSAACLRTQLTPGFKQFIQPKPQPDFPLRNNRYLEVTCITSGKHEMETTSI